MLKDRVGEAEKRPLESHAKPEQGLLFRVSFCDAPSHLAEFELPGDSTFANLHKTISSLSGDFLGSGEYEFPVSDCLRFLPHKGRTDYEQRHSSGCGSISTADRNLTTPSGQCFTAHSG